MMVSTLPIVRTQRILDKIPERRAAVKPDLIIRLLILRLT